MRPINREIERLIGVSENEYLITVNKQREPMAWAYASDAAGIELDRPESRQIANSRRQVSFGRHGRRRGRGRGEFRPSSTTSATRKTEADINESPCN